MWDCILTHTWPLEKQLSSHNFFLVDWKSSFFNSIQGEEHDGLGVRTKFKFLHHSLVQFGQVTYAIWDSFSSSIKQVIALALEAAVKWSCSGTYCGKYLVLAHLILTTIMCNGTVSSLYSSWGSWGSNLPELTAVTDLKPWLLTTTPEGSLISQGRHRVGRLWIIKYYPHINASNPEDTRQAGSIREAQGRFCLTIQCFPPETMSCSPIFILLRISAKCFLCFFS